MKFNSIIIFSIISIFGSCNRENNIKKELELLQSKPIEFCIDSLVTLSDNKVSKIINRNYMFLTFLDSSECTACHIRHMYSWDYLCDMYPTIPFIFIFETKDEDIQLLLSEKPIDTSNIFLYCDTTGYFKRHNDHIPQNRLLHTFLLGTDSKVILSGNPTTNPNIKKLIENILHNETVEQ